MQQPEQYMLQSATFKNIYIDMDTNTNPPKHWCQHMHYVALSRVTSLSGLYLKSFNSDKICVSPDVLNYVEKAKEKYKLKWSYTLLYVYNDNRLKVVYNNARLYQNHYLDVKNNHNILAADILLSESWLSSQDNSAKCIYNVYHLDQVNTVKPYHGLMACTHKNINITKITVYPGNNMEAISIFMEKVLKSSTL